MNSRNTFRLWWHIYAKVDWVIIYAGNGLMPVWHQAIIWANADLLPIEPVEWNSEIQTQAHFRAAVFYQFIAVLLHLAMVHQFKDIHKVKHV